jgi:hypothetical protein
MQRDTWMTLWAMWHDMWTTQRKVQAMRQTLWAMKHEVQTTLWSM